MSHLSILLLLFTWYLYYSKEKKKERKKEEKKNQLPVSTVERVEVNGISPCRGRIAWSQLVQQGHGLLTLS